MLNVWFKHQKTINTILFYTEILRFQLTIKSNGKDKIIIMTLKYKKPENAFSGLYLTIKLITLFLKSQKCFSNLFYMVSGLLFLF